ncbi:hypothetical protein AB834_01795 [PVC group bacterium (ex Bugula neritina AB1)]|nr:hypothetical protein AB834_01795 [PVC group bacterium (ex Bugula neritina AB1)]
MSKKGMSFLEILLVIFFVIVLASFTIPNFFDRYFRRSKVESIEWVKTLLYLAQKKAQNTSVDHYLVFVPKEGDGEVKKSAYFQRRKGLLGKSMGLVLHSKGEYSLLDDYWELPVGSFFDDNFDFWKEEDIFLNMYRIPVKIVDISGGSFSVKLPAIGFKGGSGSIIFPKAQIVSEIFLKVESGDSRLKVNTEDSSIILEGG